MVVFNSLAHERNGLVELDLSNGSQLVDTETGKAAALETVHAASGYRHVRFLAAHVPAMGYRVYRIESVAAAPAPPQPEPVNTIENEFYRVTVDPNRGAVSGVFDKQAGRELVDPKSPYLVNQYLYAAGGENTRLIQIAEHLPTANLTVTPAAGATAVNAVSTPWGKTLRYRTSGPHAPRIDVEIRLFNGEKKIEIVNRLQKDPVNEKEAIYFAFPFAAPQPEFEYEGQNGTVNPARDELAGGCREWYLAGHWARVSGGGAPSAQRGGDPGGCAAGYFWRHRPRPVAGEVRAQIVHHLLLRVEQLLAYQLSARAERRVHVPLRPHERRRSGPRRHLSRLGRESLTPLETGQLTSNDKVGLRGSLPAIPASFLTWLATASN